VTSLLVSGHVLLGIVGGSVIAIMGIRTMLSRPTGPAPDAERPGIGAFAIYAHDDQPLTLLYAGVLAGIASSGSSFVDAAVVIWRFSRLDALVGHPLLDRGSVAVVSTALWSTHLRRGAALPGVGRGGRTRLACTACGPDW
jgi:hypothetical protein